MSRICEVTGKAGLVGNMVSSALALQGFARSTSLVSRLLLLNSVSNLDFLRFAKIRRLTG